MEPRGCNRWQPVRIGQGQTPPKQAKTFAVGRDRLPFRAHGKEGVSGSSPEEGLAEMPANRAVVLSYLQAHVTRGHPQALSEVPSPWARAHAFSRE
jgi:hypothetical protein